MSRIHEALKKAAQDKATQPPRVVTADLLECATEIHRHIEPPEDVTRVENVRVPGIDPRFKETRYLNYEELIKRCSHPRWTLDARNSVFVGDDSDRIGAERFRTLRSRLYQIAGTQQLKKLLVTSSIPAVGKTFVAANLAQSIVRQSDRRVLLIGVFFRASYALPGYTNLWESPVAPDLLTICVVKSTNTRLFKMDWRGIFVLFPAASRF